MDQFIFAKRFAAPWHFELTQLRVGQAHHPQVSKRPSSKYSHVSTWDRMTSGV